MPARKTLKQMNAVPAKKYLDILEAPSPTEPMVYRLQRQRQLKKALQKRSLLRRN
jgi:hypothetical protein